MAASCTDEREMLRCSRLVMVEVQVAMVRNQVMLRSTRTSKTTAPSSSSIR
jgi:hypothetical protein